MGWKGGRAVRTVRGGVALYPQWSYDIYNLKLRTKLCWIFKTSIKASVVSAQLGNDGYSFFFLENDFINFSHKYGYWIFKTSIKASFVPAHLGVDGYYLWTNIFLISITNMGSMHL